MPYKCTHGGITRPCIYDPRWDKSLSEAGKLEKKKIYRSARKGDVFPFVCPISRKYFEATDDATRKQDAEDLATISAELKAFGVNVPEDATVWEAAANLSQLHMVERKKKERKPTRTFGNMDEAKKAVENASPEKAQGMTRDDIVARLAEKGVPHHHSLGIKKLAKLLKKSEANVKVEEVEPDPDDV